MQHKTALMCHALQHGGPDDEGFYTNAGLCFGHRRLSIIDLSPRGHQPMADVQQRVWITFNGEIYNYPELKAELKRAGAQFASDTDTEVIIQAYLLWGEAGFARLRGMFAFALHDVEHQLTYLVRDTNGIKPLYYHIQGGQISFASEVKALKQAGIATEADEAWKIRFLTYGHIPEPYTNLKHVFSLPKGSYLRWQHTTGTYELTEFSLPSNAGIITDSKEAEELISQTLRKAVNRQLLADAPIGVFLSGGVDSSLISLLAHQEQHKQLQYISIYFSEDAYNERPYQDAVTHHLSGKVHAHLVTYQDFESCLPEIMESMDLPTTDGINTWFISRYASRSRLKAVLSGLGGDELFGGYPSFRRIKHIPALKYLPVNLIGKLAGLKKDVYRRISLLSKNNAVADYLFLRGIFTPSEVAALLNAPEEQVEQILFNDILQVPAGLKGPAKASWLETNLYMQNQLLRDTDVMSMNHGLEVRVPLLDEDFTQAVNRISPELRFAQPPVKKLLVDSFKDILPEAIWNRPKMGFSFPLQLWMKQYAGISDSSLYSSAKAKKVIQQFSEGKVHWSRAFALYQIQQHA